MRRLRHFFSRWQNWLGILLFLPFILMAVAAPLLSPKDSKDPGIFKKVGQTRTERMDITPHPPSDIAPLGTLPHQYSVYHTLVWGSRDALRFGLIVVLISGLFGVTWGASAGFAGGAVNTVMMRVADAFLAFPVIAGVVFLQQLTAIAVEAAGGIYYFNFFGQGPRIDDIGASPIQILLGYISPMMLSLILFLWMPYARMTNSIVISLKNTEFIASRALGSSSMRTVFRHIIPNSIAPCCCNGRTERLRAIPTRKTARILFSMNDHECVIRSARPSDQPGAYYVCLKTGDYGKDGEPFFREDPDALGRIFVGPYLAYEPGLSLVLEDAQGICGYAFGALDSKSFYARYEAEWRPELCARFPEPTGDTEQWTRLQSVYHSYHHPDYFTPEPYEAWPSHLHIDLLERAQGRGYGRRMIEEVMTRLRFYRRISILP